MNYRYTCNTDMMAWLRREGRMVGWFLGTSCPNSETCFEEGDWAKLPEFRGTENLAGGS